MIFREFIENFVETTKNNIVELAQTELSNENKKLTLDHKIVNYLDEALENLTINFILRIALKKLLLPNVSLITQIIYDLLKEKIKGITK